MTTIFITFKDNLKLHPSIDYTEVNANFPTIEAIDNAVKAAELFAFDTKAQLRIFTDYATELTDHSVTYIAHNEEDAQNITETIASPITVITIDEYSRQTILNQLGKEGLEGNVTDRARAITLDEGEISNYSFDFGKAIEEKKRSEVADANSSAEV